MRGESEAEPANEARRAAYALPWHKVDDLTAEQVACMQSLDDARRAGLVGADDAAVIEGVIRDGHVHGARKRITEAKRRSLLPGSGKKTGQTDARQ